MSLNSYSPSFRELITALTFSLLASAGAISLATLIFSGPILSKYIIIGISGGLFGSIIFRFINLLFSSYKITISSTQELFALFGSIIAASICRELHGFETKDILSTLITAMIIMNCTTGLFMLMFGKLRISEFIRYIPYPVNSGFLAGTGLLIISFSLMAITHIAFSLQTIDLFFHPDTLWKWLIPFLYSILTIYLMRRLTTYRYLILPFMIFFAFIGFYLYLFFKGISWAQASSLGWTVGNFPNQSLVYPPSIKIISSKIHWDIIMRHIPNFLSLSFLVAINCFLNTSSFELISQKNLNMNDEFKITGLSNILIGLFGGIGGYQNIAYSKIGLSFGTVTKSVNVLVIIILGLVLFLGVSILDVIPKCVVNFVLIYFGIDLTYTYIIEIKSKISWHYYLIVLAIAFNIVYFNIFIGIIVGLMMSMLLFVIQYSKIRVMTTILNSSFITSNVERSPYEMQILEENYNKILIPIFSGYLFFGNSEKLVQKIKHRIDKSDVEIGYAILDFSRTSGMEVSCYQSLLKLLQYCNKKNIEIIFCKL